MYISLKVHVVFGKKSVFIKSFEVKWLEMKVKTNCFQIVIAFIWTFTQNITDKIPMENLISKMKKKKLKSFNLRF